MDVSSRRSAIAATVALITISIAACASAAAPSASPSKPAVAASAQPVAAAAATPATDGIPSATLLLRMTGGSDWQMVEAETGRSIFAIPAGTPSDDWHRLVSVTDAGAETVVTDSPPEPGLGGPELRIPGRWRLPTLGTDPRPVGRSTDGSTIVLVEAAEASSKAAAAATSRFAIVEHRSDGHLSTVGDADLALARVVELRGTFDYDTMSPDGRILYVVEHLDADRGGHYQVRAIDVPTGVMRDAVIVDKANPDERMAGYPIAQVRRTDGGVFTLYDGPEHPFIHALQSREAWALCIDLPAGAATHRTGWGLTASVDQTSLFAVNASAGVAVDVDPSQYAVRRWAELSTAAAPAIRLAKFGHTDVGAVGRTVVLAPDGSRLLAASPTGITVLSTADLHEIRRDLAGVAVASVGLVPDGSLGFALTDDGRVVAFDPATGHVLGDVGGGPWAELVAVAP